MMKDVLHSTCSECGGSVRSRTITQEFEREGLSVSVAGIRTLVCTKCDAVYFEPGSAQALVEAVNGLFAFAKQNQQHKGKLLGAIQPAWLTAPSVFSKVVHWFTEGFDTKDLQEAKALLNELIWDEYCKVHTLNTRRSSSAVWRKYSASPVLFARLQTVVRLLMETGQLRRLYLFGSFTTAKPIPGDLDCLAVMAVGFTTMTLTSPHLEVFQHDACRLLHQTDVFWVTEAVAQEHIAAMFDVFSRNRDGAPQPIIEVTV